jgi:hypothetical protein
MPCSLERSLRGPAKRDRVVAGMPDCDGLQVGEPTARYFALFWKYSS